MSISITMQMNTDPFYVGANVFAVKDFFCKQNTGHRCDVKSQRRRVLDNLRVSNPLSTFEEMYKKNDSCGEVVGSNMSVVSLNAMVNEAVVHVSTKMENRGKTGSLTFWNYSVSQDFQTHDKQGRYQELVKHIYYVEETNYIVRLPSFPYCLWDQLRCFGNVWIVRHFGYNTLH